MERKRSIKGKIALIAGLCLLATAGSTVTGSIFVGNANNAFVSQNVAEILDRKTKDYMQSVAAHQAQALQSHFEDTLHVARTLAGTFTVLARTGGNILPRDGRRPMLSKLLFQALEDNPGFNGTYSAWEPNALDGSDSTYEGVKLLGSDATGRILPYWTRDVATGKIAIQPLVEYDSRELHPNGVMKGGWYIGPKETGKESVLGPLPYVVQGRQVFLATMSVPIIVNSQFVGVAGTDFNLDFVQKLATDANARVFGGKGAIVILSDLGLVVADTADPGRIGKSFADQSTTFAADLKFIKDGASSVAWSADGQTLRVFAPITLGNTGKPWSVLMTVPRGVVMAEASALQASLDERAATSLVWQAGVGIGIAVLAIIAIWLAAGGISRPIVAMTGAMRRLADGDLAVDVPARGQSDEIGQMAATVQVFKDNALEMRRLQAEQDAQKDRAAAERHQTMNALADSFESSVMGIVEAVTNQSTDLETSAQTLSSVASQTEQQAATVAAASEQASVNVQTVASATNQLSASVQEISRRVIESATIANEAVRESDHVNTIVTGLASAVQKIGEVVKLITDIASQTNLLALNATIEAARAGEMGKGFAVVAGEVKNLANQTAKATEDIGAQIGAVQGATNDAVEAIRTISTTIGKVNQISTAISAAIEEQGAATQEIARNVQEAAAGVGEVSVNIASVTQASSETGSASSQVLVSARQLSELAERLRADVGAFITSVRQA
jgi:methyl-accepting chemotaxis protein